MSGEGTNVKGLPGGADGSGVEDRSFVLTDGTDAALEAAFRQFTGEPDVLDDAVEKERKRLTRVALGNDLCGIAIGVHAAALGVAEEKIRCFIANCAGLMLQEYHLQAKTAYDTQIREVVASMDSLKVRLTGATDRVEELNPLLLEVKTLVEEISNPAFQKQQQAIDEMEEAASVFLAAAQRLAVCVESMPRWERGRPRAHFLDLIAREFYDHIPNPKFYSGSSWINEGADKQSSGPGPALIHEILVKVAGNRSKPSSIAEALRKARRAQ